MSLEEDLIFNKVILMINLRYELLVSRSVNMTLPMNKLEIE